MVIVLETNRKEDNSLCFDEEIDMIQYFNFHFKSFRMLMNNVRSILTQSII